MGQFEGGSAARVRKQHVLAALRELDVDELDQNLAIVRNYECNGWGAAPLTYARERVVGAGMSHPFRQVA